MKNRNQAISNNLYDLIPDAQLADIQGGNDHALEIPLEKLKVKREDLNQIQRLSYPGVYIHETPNGVR